MILKQIAHILGEILGIDEEDITGETGLTPEYGIEPIDIARLVIECEKAFAIIIHDEDVHSLHKVRDVADYIARMRD